MLFQRTFKMSKDVPTLVSSKSCPIVSTAAFEKKKPCGIISPSAHRKYSGAGAARGPRPSRRCCSRTCAACDIAQTLLLPQQTFKQCPIKIKMQFHSDHELVVIGIRFPSGVNENSSEKRLRLHWAGFRFAFLLCTYRANLIPEPSCRLCPQCAAVCR
jgi:hypothetical protein